MLVLFELLASSSLREKLLRAGYERLGKRVSLGCARLRSELASIRAGTVLLYAIAFYIVFIRLGPVVSRVGEPAVESLREDWGEEDLRVLKEGYRIFRYLTRVPGPLGRRSDDRLLLVVSVAMGNKSSSKKADKAEGTEEVAKVQSSSEASDVAVSKEAGAVSDLPPGAKAEEEEEEGKDTVGDLPEPKKRIEKRRFSEIEDTISTGDLALLFREGHEQPHYAVFVSHSDCDPNFPLLLIKGKTRPLSLDKFNPRVRNIHPISAVTRIFYGDYSTVAVRHLSVKEPIHCATIMGMIEQVEKMPFSQEELDVIKAAETPEERSVLVCSFTMAHLYKALGLLEGDPGSVRPSNFQDQLKLSEPKYIELPPVKLGPVATGDAPFLAQLVEGIMPSEEVVTKPLSTVESTLNTGDIVLFSGATSSGAIIKLFDQSKFSHVGIILKAKYTSQLLVWEASTNKAGLVDIETGEVSRGVELLPLRHKIFSGWYNRVAIRRLVDVTDEQRTQLYTKMLELRREWQGRPYEKDQIQLILSAIDAHEWFLSFLRNKHEDLSSLFCSELVAAAYQRLGLLDNEKLSNEYTPDDFASHRPLPLKFGRLEPEVYIELKFDLAQSHAALGTQESVY